MLLRLSLKKFGNLSQVAQHVVQSSRGDKLLAQALVFCLPL
jgi:hypothetical protein